MPMDIAGKAIVVVGGASGLGLATTGLLAKAGAELAVIDVNPSSLQRCIAALASPANIVHGVCGDIVPKAEAVKLVRAA
ncbi:MAG TPA: SDR family NAD(P)-dependent oxidoreductase, partial [Aestuariivirgaceae bacterium]|nr:SDR family NAD(P)-dependent oxidoreductase [Aestuariivirgaceae bacterium]